MKDVFPAFFRQAAFVRRKFLLITAGFLLVLAVIVYPNIRKARRTASKPWGLASMSCVSFQMWIESAKAKWAAENNKSSSDIPTESEIIEFMGSVTPMWAGRKMPVPRLPDQLVCFRSGNGAKIIVGAVGQRVRCTADMEDQHAWDEQDYRDHYGLDQR